MQLETQLAAKFKAACIAELEAVKPGNVHMLADGHGMTVQDFLRSAEVAAGVIAQADLSAGQRILQAVQATNTVVGCNTNLGIILLCAPLIQAAWNTGGSITQKTVQAVLEQLSIEDANDAFAAIRIANPAGLGHSEHHDVESPASVTLLEAMQEAADRDLIARQYINGFQQVFEGLAYYRQLLARWERPAWATSALYLYFLTHFPDSHIARKYGGDLAESICAQSAVHWRELEGRDNPKTYLRPLLDFDQALKAQGINPGTSADMTVAVLLLDGLQVAA
ncbi:MAG: triphosphoribosyl-dephospho-CoA synthase [Betaproteobacteria bacterium HGW-Betaproteobacteria-2]|nr:MAG: triphosphoribosyl-dephospho-CoA synthase [Betaproteobacteria bacterium HGW-Betaproteobacteria-2]